MNRVSGVIIIFVIYMIFVTLSQAGGQILKWKGAEKDQHPRLYITAKDLPRIKRNRTDLAELQSKTSWYIDRDGADKLIVAALLTDNEAAERFLIDEAMKNLDLVLEKIPDTTIRRVGPHQMGKYFGLAMALSDAALAGKLMTADERASMLSKIAQIGYGLNDPNFWEAETLKNNYCPNMLTSAYGYRVTVAALIPSHPMAKEWMAEGMKEIKNEIDNWIDAGGGMLETPHYSMVILDQLIGACIAARNSGFANEGELFDPKLRKAMEWFGNISTPPDPHNNNLRRWPTIGHTYADESSSTFGLMAYLWKDKDPTFAANMQWMHQEHGSKSEPGIKSFYPGIMGYRTFLTDDSIRPKRPDWGSAVYPETGVLLRNTIGSDRETTLYMIAGRFHSHYFNDSGSITIWGKGRQLCHEDDYQKRRQPESEYKVGDYRKVHSMPGSPSTYSVERVMQLKEFHTTKEFDYVSGIRMGWQRQIAFVKDSNPMAPNYFVLADTFDADSVPTVWRLFLLADDIKATPDGVTVIGKDDVDMDIFFVRPGNVKPEIKLEKEHISVKVAKSGTLTTVLYPRLKTEKKPKVTALADGKGVKVITSAGTDIIFLNPESFTYTENDLEFEGKAGLVKTRGGKQSYSFVGTCDVAPSKIPGDPQIRMIPWAGPQYPSFPDK